MSLTPADPGITPEELHAYLDGELAKSDAERVVSALSADAALREEACAIRALREQLRHAYGVPSRPQSRAAERCPPVPTRWAYAMAASLVLSFGIALGWMANDWQDKGVIRYVQADPQRMVFHVANADPVRLDAMLAEASGRLAAAQKEGRPMHVEIIANNTGLDLLRVAATHHANELGRLQRDYPDRLTLVACGQGLQRVLAEGGDIHLLPGVKVATSAVDQIIRRLGDGWTYQRV